VRKWFSGRAGMALAFVLGMVIATAATAGAASLITGKQIKAGSITARNLSQSLRAQIAKTGATGAVGLQGPKGDAGTKGDTGAKGEIGPAGAALGAAALSANPAAIATAGDVPILTVALSPGTWVLTAKLTLTNSDPTTAVDAVCKLTVGSDVSRTEVLVPAKGGRQSLAFTMSHVFTAGEKSPVLTCNTGGATVKPDDAAITGVQVHEVVQGA